MQIFNRIKSNHVQKNIMNYIKTNRVLEIIKYSNQNLILIEMNI